MSSEDRDELEGGLRKRDRMFVFRLLLRLAVIVLLGVWGALLLDDTDLGGCAARGFDAVAGEESR